ncbi:MAG: hypothetical protein AAFN92_01915 [Bacteroidota bacterium]
MTEKNKHTLRDALGRLPEHDAPAGNWDRIGEALNPSLGERLPSYRPPADVWNALNQDLEAAATAPAATVRRLPGHRPAWTRFAALAAGFLLLFLAGTALWHTVNDGPKITYAYAQEVAPATSTADWGEAEASFTKVRAEIEARNEPGLNTLALELDELTEAKEDIEAMLVAYGEDPSIIRQLAEIERDRSDVYRRIIVAL